MGAVEEAGEVEHHLGAKDLLDLLVRARLAQAGDPFLAARAGGRAGGDGGDGRAARLGNGEGVDLAFDEDNGLVDVDAVGVEEGVGETGGTEVFGLAPGDLGA